jgi:hypothetical protein
LYLGSIILKQLSSLLKIPVSVLFIFLHLNASGGDPYRLSAGAGEAGMGYVCVMKNSFWSSFQNQASLADNNSVSLGFNYENRFSLKELGTRSTAIIVPAWRTTIGAVYSYFGYPDYKREMTGLACGLRLSEKLSAGVQIDYFSEKAPGEYNNYQSVTFETGLIIIPSEDLRIGVHLFNPVPNSLRKTCLPSRLRIGAGTTLSTTLFAGAECEISSGSKLILRTGLEYEAAEKLWIRCGFSTENNSFSFGSGYLTKLVRIDLGFATHEMLGVTSSVSLIFKIP